MAMFGHQAFSTLVQTIVIDLFPKKVAGSAAGLVGGVGVLGAMIFSLIAGYMVQYLGYSPVFILVGLMHPVAFLLIMLFVGKIKMVQPLKTVIQNI
jgi:ACS family hexuronate transporter-like MFS transporter